jgi:O-antigen/teichoic acid export membrane protein
MFLSFFQHLNLGLIIAKKTKYFAYIDGANCGLSFFLNYVLIKAYGVIGAALAGLVCYCVRVAAVYVISIPFYRIHFEVLRVLKVMCSAFAVYSISLLVPTVPIYASIGTKLVLICGLFPLFLLGLQTFEPNEIEFLKARIWRGRFGSLGK